MLIGQPGSGKTTLVRRLHKLSIEAGRKSWLFSFTSFAKNELLSVEQLLIGRHVRGPCDPAEVAADMAWIEAHADECDVIFDGYDQSTFAFEELPANTPWPRGCRTELRPGQLFALICAGSVLAGAHVFVSSRPHAVAAFPAAMRWRAEVVELFDLRTGDVRLLAEHYLPGGAEGAEAFLADVRARSFGVFQLAHTPIFLQLLVMLKTRLPEADWRESLTTATGLFQKLLHLLKASRHQSAVQWTETERQLSALAFRKSLEGTVSISGDDLREHELSADVVQNVMFSAIDNDGLPWYNLFDGITVFFFVHQLFQVGGYASSERLAPGGWGAFR